MKPSQILLLIISITLSTISFSQTFIENANLLGISANFGNPGGGGLSAADFNNDGLDDITYCTAIGEDLKFYQNTGSDFIQIFPTGILDTFETRQAVWIDIENDGDKDLFVTAYNNPNLLFINNGDFNFTESTSLYNLPTTIKNTYGANFADINNDGYLDLYVCNLGATNEMYVFDPESNTYLDISITSGANNGIKFSFCTVFFDYDFDGDLDFYVSNDGFTYQNGFYRNNGNLTFTDISTNSGAGISIASMNTAIGDYNNDGYWDIYCTNISTAPSALLSGTPFQTFVDVASNTNTTFNRFGWGANFFDFNNDSWLDLYVVGTTVNANQPAALYQNKADGTFCEPLFYFKGIGGSDTTRNYSTSVADFNLDGNLDIFNISNSNLPVKIFSNYEQNESNYLKLKLKGVESNLNGLGTLIEVWQNNQKRIFTKHCGDAFLSQNSDLVHIGLGNNCTIDSIILKWQVNGNVDVLAGSQFICNNIYEITELNPTATIINSNLCKNIHNVILSPIPSQIYGSETNTKSSSKVENGFDVVFISEQLIELNAGFEVDSNANFEATINACNNY